MSLTFHDPIRISSALHESGLASQKNIARTSPIKRRNSLHIPRRVWLPANLLKKRAMPLREHPKMSPNRLKKQLHRLPQV